jgi:hypothetical protein
MLADAFPVETGPQTKYGTKTYGGLENGSNYGDSALLTLMKFHHQKKNVKIEIC